ncbi:hypothetical protein ES703_60640 [subsurface metagenome]
MVPTLAWAYIATRTPHPLQNVNIRSTYSGNTSMGTQESSIKGSGLRSPFIPSISPKPFFLTPQTLACSVGSVITGQAYPSFCSCRSVARARLFSSASSDVSPKNSTTRIAFGSPWMKPHSGATLRFFRALITTSASSISTADGLCFKITATVRIASSSSVK